MGNNLHGDSGSNIFGEERCLSLRKRKSLSSLLFTLTTGVWFRFRDCFEGSMEETVVYVDIPSNFMPDLLLSNNAVCISKHL
jgi:hypothetical protein